MRRIRFGCSSNATKGATVTAGDKPKTQDATTPPEDKTPITIQYWHSHPDTQLDGMKMIIADFNKKYLYITIEPVFQGAYPDLAKKLVTAMAAKDVPAVTVAENSVMPSLAYNGALADLGTFIKRDKVDVNDFSKGMMDAYAFNGKQYGIPFVVSMNTLLYNKTLLDKEGVKVPETWADVEAMQKLVKKEGKYVDALGYFPTHKSVFNSPQGQDFFKRNPYLKAIFDHFDDVVTRPQTPTFAETKLPTQAVFDRIVLKNMDIEASFKQGAKEVNEILKSYK